MIVDDDQSIRRALAEALRGWGYQPVEAGTVAAGVSTFEAEEPAAVLLDIDLPDGSGLGALREIKHRHADAVVIMITASVAIQSTISALRGGAYDFVGKPLNLEELRVTIRNGTEASRLRREVSQVRRERARQFSFEQIIGESPAIRYDITERKRAEQRIREQAALLDQARDAIVVHDMSYDKILYWNQAAERIYGWTAEEAVGNTGRDLQLLNDLNAAEFERGRASVMERGEWAGELSQRTKRGDGITVESRWTLLGDDKGEPRSILVINTDVTERKKVEAQLLRARRMESIGTLAGGIAHDLNNILSPILMAVQMLQLKVGDDESARQWLDILQANAERGADMVRQVLSFARGVEGGRVVLQPNHLVKEVIKILKDTLPKSIEIKFDVASDLWPISADATQIHQVLMNLCVNARDAMPGGGGLFVRAENVTLDDLPVSAQPALPPRRHAPRKERRAAAPFLIAPRRPPGRVKGVAQVHVKPIPPSPC